MGGSITQIVYWEGFQAIIRMIREDEKQAIGHRRWWMVSGNVGDNFKPFLPMCKTSTTDPLLKEGN
jgi:hypothetical protein